MNFRKYRTPAPTPLLPALLILCLLAPAFPLRAQAPNSPVGNHLVGTVLGESRGTGIGDARLEARLIQAGDLAFLPGGEALVMDARQHRVLRVGADGIVRPFAGNGKAEVSGDGGAAVEAGIYFPTRIAADGQGAVYIAHRSLTGTGGIIRKVDTTGKISTVAGTGVFECPEIGALAKDSKIPNVLAMAASPEAIYFNTSGCPAVYSIDSDGRIGFVVSSTSDNPGGDSGVVASQKAISASRIAVGSILDLAVDRSGNLLVASRWGGLLNVYLVTPEDVAILVAGGGVPGLRIRQGASETVFLPNIASCAPLPNGEIAIAQNGGTPFPDRRTEVGIASREGEYRILFTGDGAGGKPTAEYPGGYVSPSVIRAAPDGSLYVIDGRSGAILRVNPDGATTPFLGPFPAERIVTPSETNPVFQVSFISNLASDAAGNLYFSALQKIYRLTPQGALTHIAGNGDLLIGADVPNPFSIGIGNVNQLQVLADGSLFWLSSDSRIRKLTPGGGISTVLGGGNSYPQREGIPGTGISLQRLQRWSVAANGEIYFMESTGDISRIWRMKTDGIVTAVTSAVSGSATAVLDGVKALEAILPRVEQMGVSPEGNVFFSTGGGLPEPTIYRIDDHGIIRTVAKSQTGFELLVDGTPTLSAPSYPGNLFLPLAADRLLLSAGTPRALAAYPPGGSVTLWRDPSQGVAFNDGALLRDDLYWETSTLTVLPDGGLAWADNHGGNIVIRRSFPVPNGCTYTTSANEISVSGGNVLTQVTLTTGADCPWTVGTSASWLEILSPRFGKGPATMNLRALANPSPSERAATLRIAGNEVLVRQAPSTLPNIFVVTPASAEVPAAGGAVTVTISASPGLSWQVALPGIPISITGPSAGSGSGSFVLTLEALPANQSERTAVVTVNDKTVTLRQAAQPGPVTVTVNSVPAGSKATVDLVERTLPFVAQWVPGSYHFLQAAEITRVNDNTLIQFQSFGTTDPSAAQVLVTPNVATTLTAQYRRLHLLRARPLLQTLPTTIRPLLSFQGVTVPTEYVAPVFEDGALAMWYPEGKTVQLFAPEEAGVRFVNFTGGLSTTENPTTVSMTGPATITANYVTDTAQQQTFVLGGTPRWWFSGPSRNANPAQVTIAPATADAQTETRRFVSYDASIDSPEWLTLRASNLLAPFTLEVGVDVAKAEMFPDSPLGAATVYLHRPGTRTASFNAMATVRQIPADNLPWISVITDAGGFRQSTNDNASEPLVVAPGMILTAFGVHFGAQPQDAATVPLPTVLGGVSLEVQQGGTGPWVAQPLFFVSDTQINFQVLPTLFAADATGDLVRFRVRTGPSTVSEPWNARLRQRSVSLFSADVSGGGAPAGFFVRVLPDQSQQRGNLFACANGVCTVPAVAFGGTENDLFLELFGTGFRTPGLPDNVRAYIGGQAAEVTFAGPHPVFVGLDQLNVKVPRDIPKGIPLDLYVWVRNGNNPWIASNRLTVRFQ